MNEAGCIHPIELPALIAYWLSEQDESEQEAVEEHLLGCAHCSARLAEFVALASGVRTVFRQGVLRAFVTPAFVRQLADRGLRLREYTVPRNGSVNCSVAPEDEVVIARLQAPLAGVVRVDAYSYVADAPPEVATDIPFDPASGEVIIAPKTARLRSAPSYQHRVRLVAVDAHEQRIIGEYTFNHSAATPT